MIDFNNFSFEKAFGTAAQLPPATLPEIAFSGRSNVGKSSLINKLCGKKGLAKTSSVPGKTITVNFFRSGNTRLVDLPGYGYAKRPASEKERWAELMEGYFNTGREIKLVVQLIDMRHAPSADDKTMLEFLENSGYKYIIALTKADKLKPTELAKRREEIRKELGDISCGTVIETSAEKGSGINELRSAINNA